MGIYWRYKNTPGGFRTLVELLESTPAKRRQNMVNAGLAEDPGYTMTALRYVLNFDDVVDLPDMELAEVLAKSKPQIVAYALQSLPEQRREKFMRNASPALASEVKDMLSMKVGPREIAGAQLKLITTARELERKGLVRTKQIPNAA